LFALFT
jgi:hypothetical protein